MPLRLKDDVFEFQGQRYRYYENPGERTVEVPVVLDMILHSFGKVLEVGNVMKRRCALTEITTVDLYEVYPGVINVDIVDFDPSERYSLVVCVSTIEHVGLDELPYNDGKMLVALQRMNSLLVPGGKAVITFPLGFRQGLDGMLLDGRLSFETLYCMKRVSSDNRWVEAAWEDIKDCEYGRPYPSGNGLVIGLGVQLGGNHE